MWDAPFGVQAWVQTWVQPCCQVAGRPVAEVGNNGHHSRSSLHLVQSVKPKGAESLGFFQPEAGRNTAQEETQKVA